jgi:arylsulfatase A-like enzyme
VGALRADHLGCYGYPRATSPRIDAFARGAIRFREGRAQAPWSRPAVATLLTGLLPVAHRAEADADRLPERVVTLAERLAAAGYQTAMVTADDGVAGRFGFQQGFETFVALRERKRSRAVHARAAEVGRVAAEMLDRRDRARPLFLVALVADPAAPYVPEARWRERLAAGVRDPSVGTRRGLAGLAALSGEAARRRAAELAALYDAEIGAVDEAFGALLDRLDARAPTARAAVFLVGVHGEELADHGGWGHGATLFEEQLRVPFLVRLPGGTGAGTVRAGVAEQIDLAPTVLALTGLRTPAGLPGRDLLAEADPPGAAASSLPSFAFLGRSGHRSASVVAAQWKLIQRAREEALLTRPPVELYALGSDPGERADLALERPLHRAWLAGELAAVEARPRAARGGARRPGESAPERRAQPRGGF